MRDKEIEMWQHMSVLMHFETVKLTSMYALCFQFDLCFVLDLCLCDFEICIFLKWF